MLSALTLFACCDDGTAQSIYTVLDLGSFGGVSGGCWGLNSAGVVVGQSKNATGQDRAFIWNPTSGLVDLGTLGGTAGVAYDINDAGIVVGSARRADGTDAAFTWSTGTGMLAIPGLPPSRPSYAYGINLAGRVVGSLYNSLGLERAFRYEPATGVVDPFPQLTLTTSAKCVNASGKYAGYYSSTGTDSYGYISVTSGVMTFGPQYWTYPYGVNDGGTVVGEYSNGAFRWNSPSETCSPISIPAFAADRAYAISNAGTIVGYGHPASNRRHGFIFADAYGMRDINALLAPGTTFEVTELRDINASGRLAGMALSLAGDSRPVLLLPPGDPLACYANCDGSGITPILTANDFTCFLNRFAAGDSRANCDGSTTAPVLTANDFTCFLNSFAGGCS